MEWRELPGERIVLGEIKITGISGGAYRTMVNFIENDVAVSILADIRGRYEIELVPVKKRRK